MKPKYLLLLFPVLLTSCSKSVKPLENKIFCFDTMINVKLYEGEQNDLTELTNLFSKYGKLSDNYQSVDFTNVYTLNHTNEEVTVTKELYDLLKCSFDVKNEGANYFNPLCGSLAKKWKESLKNQQILAENAKNEEVLKISSSSVVFGNVNKIQRLGEAEIDLGGIAKGYALDQAKNYLVSKGYKNYLIDGGSSSILLGEKNSKDGLFSVGIKDLSNSYLKLKNCFVSSSSISEQGVVIDNVKYSHIVNPLTGSVVNENDAVIVVSDKGYYGDAMSTSLMMNTIDEIKTLEAEHNFKAIVIKNNQIAYCNERLEVFHR